MTAIDSVFRVARVTIGTDVFDENWVPLSGWPWYGSPLDFSDVPRSIELEDERGRAMRFPARRDYVDFLVKNKIVADENAFISRGDLNEEVYLDWLRRGQVGCVFAQLLGRRRNRSQMRTTVLKEKAPDKLANEIDAEAVRSMANPEIEGLSILLTTIVDSESFLRVLAALVALPRWRVPRQSLWGKTLVQLGLEFQIEGRR